MISDSDIRNAFSVGSESFMSSVAAISGICLFMYPSSILRNHRTAGDRAICNGASYTVAQMTRFVDFCESFSAIHGEKTTVFNIA